MSWNRFQTFLETLFDFVELSLLVGYTLFPVLISFIHCTVAFYKMRIFLSSGFTSS
jgi:hypothetical protein